MRPVVARIATLSEIENSWTLIDLCNANEALDIQSEAEQSATEKARRDANKSKGGRR